MDGLTRAAFLDDLREALAHLYDAAFLRESPLASLLGVANRFDTARALRKILSEAIKSLKPQADDPAQAHAWRIYDSLFYCYIQQMSQRVAADQLAISPRQLRREQQSALEELADLLWRWFDLAARQDTSDAVSSPPNSLVVEELGWLKDLPPEEPTHVDLALANVVALSQSLAQSHGVQLETRVDAELPALAVHPVALNQILLSLLGIAIPRARGGAVTILARSLRWEAEIEIAMCRVERTDVPLEDDERTSASIAQHLASLVGGHLELTPGGGELLARVRLPALEQMPVLAIDDNADTLQLLRRYAAGTRYRLIGIQDPEEALRRVSQIQPEIILLDVMMPQVDGWQLLSRLREHPQTSHIPVVVCTILCQQALARSLGAAGFVRKPITRQAFLAALDAQVAERRPVPD